MKVPNKPQSIGLLRTVVFLFAGMTTGTFVAKYLFKAYEPLEIAELEGRAELARKYMPRYEQLSKELHDLTMDEIMGRINK